jgi:uncharacterized protein
MTAFGLKETDIEFIKKSLSSFNEIEKAVIFGSRAKGSYKPGSDIDIAIFGDNINFDIIARLHSQLEEQSMMPYFFDIVDYTHCDKIEIKEHIDRVGKIIYKKG